MSIARYSAMRRTSGRRAWLPVFGLIFVCACGGNQFTPLLLLYKEQQHYSAFVVNTFLGVYVLGLAPALLLAGALSDRHGRRPVAAVGVACALAASVCLAFSSTGALAISVGRLLSGIGVGVAMSVGTSWLKELSQVPHDPDADAGAGASRASLAFTLGSGLGGLVAGAIAQWGPWAEQLPFVVTIAITLPFAWLIHRAQETSVSGDVQGPWYAQLRVPSAGHKRYTHVVVVAAPWIFVAAALAYGYLPVLLSSATGHWGLAYATLLSVITLGAAALVQPWAKRVDSRDSARGVVVSLLFITAGIIIAAAAMSANSIVAGVTASLVLGVGMGIGLASCLLEVHRITTRMDLAGLTGNFYAISYAGFLTPAVIAGLSGIALTLDLLLALAVFAALCCLGVLVSYRKHLPAGQVDLAADGPS